MSDEDTRTQYDGTEPVFEKVGAVNTPLFTGPGAGEAYGRLPAGGAQCLLPDALGSTVAITNAATGNPNVKALVYVAAFAPDEGDTVDVLSAGAYTTTYSSVGFNGFPPLVEHFV